MIREVLMKKTKNFLISILIFILAFIAFIYFYATRNASEDLIKGVYFSAKSAVDSWDKNSSDVLYEFGDEKFYVRFCEDEDVYSAKKDLLVWVRDNHSGFPLKKSGSSIHCTSVGDMIYIYGVTQRENVQEVVISDSWLNRRNAEFNGKKIESKNALFFCIKLSRKKFALSDISILFVDGDNNIVSELPKTNTEEDDLIDSLLDNINPDIQTVNRENLRPSSLNFKKETAEKFFLVREENMFVLEVFSEGIEIQFYDDFALLTKRKTVTKYSDAVTNNHYHTSYKLGYNDDLIKLKQYAINAE